MDFNLEDRLHIHQDIANAYPLRGREYINKKHTNYRHHKMDLNLIKVTLNATRKMLNTSSEKRQPILDYTHGLIMQCHGRSLKN